MEEGSGQRWLVLRTAVAVLCSLGAAVVAAALQLRPLDVALYAVLAPIGALTLLIALPGASGALRLVSRRPATPSVVPEPESSSRDEVDLTGPALTGGALTAPELTVARARDRLLAARAAGGDLGELLELSTALHDAALELARVTLASGGDVPQALRDEIVLLDRAERVQPTTPAV